MGVPSNTAPLPHAQWGAPVGALRRKLAASKLMNRSGDQLTHPEMGEPLWTLGDAATAKDLLALIDYDPLSGDVGE